MNRWMQVCLSAEIVCQSSDFPFLVTVETLYVVMVTFSAFSVSVATKILKIQMFEETQHWCETYINVARFSYI